MAVILNFNNEINTSLTPPPKIMTKHFKGQAIKLYPPSWWQVLTSNLITLTLPQWKQKAMFRADILIKFTSSAHYSHSDSPLSPRASRWLPSLWYTREHAKCSPLSSETGPWAKVSLLQIHYQCTILTGSRKTIAFPKYQKKAIIYLSM